MRGGAGAGNPAGSLSHQRANNGTGGLMIIYGQEIRNGNGKIQSKGGNGGVGYNAGGGGSGGGSINIFYKNLIEQGDINADGGNGGAYKNTGVYGGAGGNGTITVGNISTGTFVSNQ